MTLRSGVIESIQEYPSKYKWPDGKLKPSNWAMRVDNVRYGCKGVKPPPVGTNVQFEAEQNGEFWNADGSTIKTIEARSQAVNSAGLGVQAAPAQAYNNLTGQKLADPRQDSIIYQSSRKDALELVRAMLDKDLIDFGKAKGAQKIELVEIYLDQYTVRFMEDVKRLAPPDHDSPVSATYSDEALALTKPARKTKVAPVDENGFDDDLPQF